MTPRALDRFDGTTMDSLLHGVAAGGDEAIHGAVRDVRLAIRAERPVHSFVITEDVEARLREILTSLVDEQAEMVADGLRLACGEAKALDIRRKWSLARAVPPPDIELPAFDNTKSFDAVSEKLEALFDRADPLEMLIRGHLWLEYAINALLDRAMTDTSHLDKARLSFNQRLAVAAALGLVPGDEVSTIRAINRLRNRVAHELDAGITSQDEAKILSAAGPELRSIVEKPLTPETPVPVRTAGLIYILVVRLHRYADHRDTHQRYDQYLMGLVDETLAKHGLRPE